jgi:hypothetical protein
MVSFINEKQKLSNQKGIDQRGNRQERNRLMRAGKVLPDRFFRTTPTAIKKIYAQLKGSGKLPFYFGAPYCPKVEPAALLNEAA